MELKNLEVTAFADLLASDAPAPGGGSTAALEGALGAALTATVPGGYDALFHAADAALYTVKRGGRGQYRFYDESMKQMLSVISPIDSDEQNGDSAPAEQKGDGQA